MGVRRAVDMALDAANTAKNEPIYTYGHLIHNPQVLSMLEEKKIFRFEKIPEKGSGIVLVRAHGVPPEDEKALEKSGFSVINATCPRVAKVQVIIKKYARKGYATIIIGDKKHPEVIGLLGYADNRGYTVITMAQFEQLPEFKNAVVVAQTTQDTQFYEQVKKWCKIHAPHYKLFDTICGSTERRQVEIRKLANENDAVIVVGGKESGNTKRLAQIAAGTGKPSIHIEDVSQIDFKELSSARSIALTAGASTPSWIINDTSTQVERNLQKSHPARSVLLKIREFLLKTNVLAAAGAGFLTYACSAIQGFDKDLRHALIAMLYVLSMHIMNHLFMNRSDKYNNPQRASFYKNNSLILWICALLSGGAGLYLSFSAGVLSFILLLMMTLLGLSYNIKFIPFIIHKGKFARIKDIPGSKTILITTAWGTATCFLPAVTNQSSLLPVAVVFLFAAGLVFARTAFFDILAIQGDRIAGRETLPILIGEKRSFNLIQYILIFDVCLVLLAYFMGLLVNKAFLLAFIPIIMFLLIRRFKNDTTVSVSQREFVIEFTLLGAGMLSVLI